MLNLISNKIVVEYAEPSSNNIYGDVVSSIGSNPADILEYLNKQLGFIQNVENFEKLRQYCNNNEYYISRYIDSDQDIFQLMLSICQNLNAGLFSTSTGLQVIFKKDKSNYKIINDYISKKISYTDVYTHYKLIYGLSCFSEGEKKQEKIIEKINLDAINIIKNETHIEITSEWIQDDNVAILFLNNYIDINSKQRELLDIDVPNIIELENGDTILFNNKYYRVLELSNNNSIAVSLKCVEII